MEISGRPTMHNNTESDAVPVLQALVCSILGIRTVCVASRARAARGRIKGQCSRSLLKVISNLGIERGICVYLV